MKRLIFCFVLPLLALGLLSGCGEKKAAVINDATIYQKDLDRRINTLSNNAGRELSDSEKETLKQLKKKLLNDLVNQELVRQAAKELGIKLDKEIVEKQTRAQIYKIPGEGAFLKQLELKGMTAKDFKQIIEAGVLAGQIKAKLYEEAETPSEETLRSFYEKRKGLFIAPEEIRIRDIVLANTEDVKAATAEIEKQVPMDQVARKYSVDASTKETGGDLGFIKRGTYGPEFETAAFGIPKEKGQIYSTTIKNIPHLMELLDWRDSRQLSFDEAKQRVQEAYKFEEATRLYNEWMKKFKKKAKIKIYID